MLVVLGSRALCRECSCHAAGVSRGGANVLQIVVYAVILFALWNIPGARVVINPLKLFAIGWHEMCHAIVVRDPLFCGIRARLACHL